MKYVYIILIFNILYDMSSNTNLRKMITGLESKSRILSNILTESFGDKLILARI